MPVTKLQFKPGINKETTSYSNEGGWNDCDKIRFRFGYPEKIGGWEKLTNNTYLGTPRTLHTWTNLAGDKFLGLGTDRKYYIESGGTYNDITPIRLTVKKAVNETFTLTGLTLTSGLGSVTLDATQVVDTNTEIVGVTVLGTVEVSIEPGVLVPVGN
jgi:hypothetical protein|tara:strand:+ start:1105 stop:1575 length:471 start_codon:yes stop_codon:yes gene_type:complete